MTKRVTYVELAGAVDRLNSAVQEAHPELESFVLQHGPQGKVILTTADGRPVLGNSCGLGMGSIPKAEMLRRVEAATAVLEAINYRRSA